MIAREMVFYISLRQAYLLSPLYSNRISSRTVLFTSVPEEFLNEGKLRKTFGKAVKNLWIARDCEKIAKLVKERDQVAFKLEAAETKLIKLAGAARLKAIKKGTAPADEPEVGLDGESGSVAARWVDPKHRPTHRLKFLIGKKVDTINWCRSELERLIPEVDALQASYRAGEAKYIPSVFIEFYTQTEAQAAYQSLAHHQALHMAPRFIGIDPEQVIWKNLSMSWAKRIISNILALTFVTVLIIFWSIPVGFVGILSNIDGLIATYSWLEWLNKIPAVIFGVVKGLLPAVLLAVLMALLPIILRLAAKMSGAPSLAAIELRTQNFYFAFQIIQVFLVATLASAASATAAKIVDDPSQATALLSQNLPKASNFYLSFIIVQGLTLSAAALAQIVGVIIFKILGKLLDNTPRKMYTRFVNLAGLGWGTVLPIYTNLLVISKLCANPGIDQPYANKTLSVNLLNYCATGAWVCDNCFLPILPCQSLQPPFRIQRAHRYERIDISSCLETDYHWRLSQHCMPDRSLWYQYRCWPIDPDDYLAHLPRSVPCVVECSYCASAHLSPQISPSRRGFTSRR